MNIGYYQPRTRFVLDFGGLQRALNPPHRLLDQPSDSDFFLGTAKWEDSESKPPATAGEVVVEQIVAATRGGLATTSYKWSFFGPPEKTHGITSSYT